MIYLLHLALYTDNIPMRFFAATLFSMTYFPSLLIVFYFCGQLHFTIKSAYSPLIKLSANKNIKSKTNVHIVRILDFINSDYCGFRCGSLFLVRKHFIIEVKNLISFKVIYNIILLLIGIPNFNNEYDSFLQHNMNSSYSKLRFLIIYHFDTERASLNF